MDEKQLVDKVIDSLMELSTNQAKSASDLTELNKHMIKWMSIVLIAFVITVGLCVSYSTHMTYNYDYQYDNTNTNINENKNTNDGGN